MAIVEIRAKLNKNIPRDKVIINFLSQIPSRERAITVKNLLAKSIEQFSDKAVFLPQKESVNTSKPNDTDELDRKILDFADKF